jgi:hypothetical protein
MASVRKMAEELRPGVGAFGATSSLSASVCGRAVAPVVGVHGVAPLDVVATSMVSNVNDEPHFDVDDELVHHIMDEENIPVDEGTWIDDDESNVAPDLANRVEDEVRLPTFKETYVYMHALIYFS